MTKDTENLDRFDRFIEQTQAIRMAAEANLAVGEKNMKVLAFRQNVTSFRNDEEWHNFYDTLKRAAASSKELAAYFDLLESK